MYGTMEGQVELQENTNNTEEKKEEKMNKSAKDLGMIYLINDRPPWYLCILLGIQHYFSMFGGTLTKGFIIAGPMCFQNNPVVIGEVLSTIFFISGICTLLQTTFGVRLPIVQGGSFSFIAPTFTILSLEKWKCPSVSNVEFASNSSSVNATNYDPDLWKPRMNEIQGAIMMASLFEIVIGFSGLIGVLVKFIGPLTIAPTVTMIGLPLYVPAANYAGGHWGISLMTIVLVVVFSQYLKEVAVPVYIYERNKGFTRKQFKLFKLFPVILAIIISWIVCLIITEAGGFPAGSKARTDEKIAISKAQWFRFPYPGQWGTPTVSLAGFFGMLAASIASIIESIGDYYACARMSGAPPPPGHAMNRGIGIEGLGCLLAGLWGTGNGTTSYSSNIGVIGITKVGSRVVIQVAAVFMVLLAVFGKFCALLTTIPDPVIGGIQMVMFGMIVSVGISNVRFVDLNSSRNLFVLGFSLLMGMAVPYWFNENDVIKTGITELDKIFKVLLTTNMFVAGVVGCFFDNTIPGSLQERGMIAWKGEMEIKNSDESNNSVREIYNLPFCLSRISKYKFAKYVPFLPFYPKSYDVYSPDNSS